MTWEELKKSLENIPEEHLHETAMFEGYEMQKLVRMTGENTAVDLTELMKRRTVIVGTHKIIVSWFPKVP